MRTPQTERRVAANGELVYYACGSGPVILFAGGLGASWHAFRPQIAHLADRYRCLAWNYRGLFPDTHAPTARASSIADHAADALAILDNEGAERAAVIGWSLGVQVALAAFARAEARIALLMLVSGGARAPWGQSPDAGPIRRMYPSAFRLFARAPQLVASLARAGVSSPEAFTWARRIGLVGSGVDAELFAEVATNFAKLDIDRALQTLADMEQTDLGALLGSVDVPTLVIGGDRDPFTSRAALERLVQRIPGAEYLLLPGASHYLLLDHAQHVNLRIDKFFAERGFAGHGRAASLHPR
jgi:pimeloyl-ACP methyl ester carboxylesterase